MSDDYLYDDDLIVNEVKIVGNKAVMDRWDELVSEMLSIHQSNPKLSAEHIQLKVLYEIDVPTEADPDDYISIGTWGACWHYSLGIISLVNKNIYENISNHTISSGDRGVVMWGWNPAADFSQHLFKIFSPLDPTLIIKHEWWFYNDDFSKGRTWYSSNNLAGESFVKSAEIDVDDVEKELRFKFDSSSFWDGNYTIITREDWEIESKRGGWIYDSLEEGENLPQPIFIDMLEDLLDRAFDKAVFVPLTD